MGSRVVTNQITIRDGGMVFSGTTEHILVAINTLEQTHVSLQLSCSLSKHNQFISNCVFAYYSWQGPDGVPGEDGSSGPRVSFKMSLQLMSKLQLTLFSAQIAGSISWVYNACKVHLLLALCTHCRPLMTYMFSATVEPLFRSHPLSDHSLWSGQLSKSQNVCQYNAVNKTSIMWPWPPFSHPDEGLLWSFTPIKWPPIENVFTRLLALCWNRDDRYKPKIESHDC